MRKLFTIYPALPEHLAATLLPAEPPPYSLADLQAYADGSVRYTPASFWEPQPEAAEEDGAAEAATADEAADVAAAEAAPAEAGVADGDAGEAP